MSRTATILGKVSVTPKGAWNGANSYNFLDIVSNAGSSYLAVQPVAAGTPLDNTSYWLQIAAKGDPGQDGTDGAAGEITGASASISGGVGTPSVTVTPGGTPTARTFAFVFTNLKGEQGETGNGIASIVKTGTAGLVDTYTITYTDGTTATYEVKNGAEALDATLTLEGYAADAKAVGDALALKQNAADPAGLADNLTPYSADSGATQSVPFINQGTGCGNGESIVDTGSYAQVKKKLGNSAGVNQIIQNGNFAATTGWSAQYGTLAVSGNKGTYTRTEVNSSARLQQTVAIPAGRKLWITVTVTPSAATKLRLTTNAGESLIDSYDVAAGEKVTKTVIVTLQNATNTLYFYNDRAAAGAIGDTVIYENAYVIDLSLWYGSTSAIPAHLLSHPEDFGKYYSGSLAYNPGQLVNADGSVLTSIGRNIFDKAQTLTESYYLGSGNAPHADSSWDYTDYIEIIPNTDYYASVTGSNPSTCFYDKDKNFISGLKNYTITANNKVFTTPANAKYLRTSIEKTKVDTFVISLYYPGESGYDQYYPFSVLAQIDTGSETLRSAGSVADEKTPDGTITRRVGVVDLGTLAWTANFNGINGLFYATIPNMKYPANTGERKTGIQSDAYLPAEVVSFDNTFTDKAMARYGGMILIRDTSYADAPTFAAAVSGKYLHYELATPTTEQGTPFSGASADNFAIDDFGSMYWTQTNGVPQGVEIFYPYDYKAAVDTILNEVNGDVTKLVTSEKVPDAPSSNGTYVLKVTVSGGTPTYSWVAE